MEFEKEICHLGLLPASGELSNCDFSTPPQLQNDREYPDTSKNKSQNFLLSYGGARRERVLRGRVALIAGASSQRLPLSRLLWVLSCSKKVPRRRHRTRTRKSLRLRQFSLVFVRRVGGALHPETGHAKTAISPLAGERPK